VGGAIEEWHAYSRTPHRKHLRVSITEPVGDRPTAGAHLQAARAATYADEVRPAKSNANQGCRLVGTYLLILEVVPSRSPGRIVHHRRTTT
jgi:hypothetical protein